MESQSVAAMAKPAVTKDISTVVRFPGCSTTFEIIDRSIAKYGVDDILYKKHPSLWKELPRGLSFVYAHSVGTEAALPAPTTTTGVTHLPPLTAEESSSTRQLIHVLAGVYKFGNFEDLHLCSLLSPADSDTLRQLVTQSNSSDKKCNSSTVGINRIWMTRKENGSCFHVSAFRHSGVDFWHIGSKNSHLIVRDAYFLEDLDTPAYGAQKFGFAKVLARCFHDKVLLAPEAVRKAMIEWFVAHPYLSFVGEACLAEDPHLVQYCRPGEAPEDKIMFFAVSEYTPVDTAGSKTPVTRQCVAMTPVEAHTLFTTTLGMPLEFTVTRLDEIRVVHDHNPNDDKKQALKLSSAHVPISTTVPQSALPAVWETLTKSYEFEENSEGAVIYSGVGPLQDSGCVSKVQRMFKYKNVYYVVDRALREAMKRGDGPRVFNKRFDFFHLPVHLYCASSAYNRAHPTPNLNTYMPLTLGAANALDCGDRSDTHGLSFMHYCYAFYCYVDQRIRETRAALEAGAQGVDAPLGVPIASWGEISVKYIHLKEQFRRETSCAEMMALLESNGLLGVEELEAAVTPAHSATQAPPTAAVTVPVTETEIEMEQETETELDTETGAEGRSPVCALRLPRQVVVLPVSIPAMGKSTLLRSLHGLVGGRYLNQDQLNGSNAGFQAHIRHSAGPFPDVPPGSDAAGVTGGVPSVLILDKCHHTAKVRAHTAASILQGHADRAVSTAASRVQPEPPLLLWVQLLHGDEAEGAGGGGGNGWLQASLALALERVKARGLHHPNLIYVPPVAAPTGSTPLLDALYQPRVGFDPNRKVMGILNGFALSFEYPSAEEEEQQQQVNPNGSPTSFSGMYSNMLCLDARRPVEELIRELLTAVAGLCSGMTGEDARAAVDALGALSGGDIGACVAAVRAEEARTRPGDRALVPAPPPGPVKAAGPKVAFQYVGIRYTEQGCTARVLAAVNACMSAAGRDVGEFECTVQPLCEVGEEATGEHEDCVGPVERAVKLARSCFHTTLLHRVDLRQKQKDSAVPHPMQQLLPLVGASVEVTVSELCFDQHILALPCSIGLAKPIVQSDLEAVEAEEAVHVFCKNAQPHITFGIRACDTSCGTEGSDRPTKITGAYSNDMLAKRVSADAEVRDSVHVLQLPVPLRLVGTIEKVYY